MKLGVEASGKDGRRGGRQMPENVGGFWSRKRSLKRRWRQNVGDRAKEGISRRWGHQQGQNQRRPKMDKS